jgi:hypothetical protein
MSCDGILGERETVVFLESVEKKLQGMWWEFEMQVDMEQRLETAGDFALFLMDGNDLYYDNIQPVTELPQLLPCLGWGRKETFKYSICLSHACSVSIDVDVVVVPTSFWRERDSDEERSVVQMVTSETRSRTEIEIDRCNIVYHVNMEIVGLARGVALGHREDYWGQWG